MDNKIISLEQNNKIKIKYVVHLADIHIRRVERTIEYRHVFNNLYENLKNNKNINKNNTIIVVCGDILHDKNNLHSCSVKLLKEFFVLLCDIAPCICIPGNHDISYNNVDYDALGSIIEKHFETKNKLYLLKESGLYEYNNIIFGFSNFIDNKIIKCDIKTNKYKCALYHGTLSGYTDHDGYRYSKSKYIDIDEFEDYDFVFLGDIHKHTFIDDDAAYPGSLIQQHVGESLIKGYILWNLEQKKGKFKRIKSDYGIVKITIDEHGHYNKIDYKNMPKFLDLHIDCMTLNHDYINILCNELKNNDIVIKSKKIIQNTDIIKINTKMKIGDIEKDLSMIKSKNSVINLILDKIKNDNKEKINNKKFKYDFDILSEYIEDIIDNYNFNSINTNKNIKLIKLTFNGMALYKNNNVIDFNKLHGIIGIEGGNSTGKSALIDCIFTAIYGINTRGTKSDIINVEKNGCESEIIIDVSGKIYKINRSIKFNSKSNSKLNRNVREIIKIYENDINISGDTLPSTRKIIDEKICSLNEFIQLCFIPQKLIFQSEVIGFTELDGKKKRDLLCKICNLDIFDKIYTECKSLTTKNKIKSTSYYNILMKKYNEYGKSHNIIQKNLNELLKNDKNELCNINNIINKNQKIKDKLIKNKVEIEYEIKQIKNKNHDNLCNEIIDIETINNEIENNKSKHNELNNLLITNKNDLLKYENINEKRNKFDLQKKTKIKNINKQLNEKQKKIWNIDIKDIQKYDKCILINDKKKLKLEIEHIKTKISNIDKQIKNKNKKIIKYEKEINEQLIINYDNKLIQYNLLEDTINKNKVEYDILCNTYEQLQNHEYDSNCKYCMKNNDTKKKILLENQINELNCNIEKINIEKNKYDKYFIKNNTNYDKQKIIKGNLEILNKEVEELNNNCNNENNILDNKINELEKIENIIVNYEKFIDRNNEIKKIDELNKELENVLISVFDEDEKFNKLNNDIINLEHQLITINNILEQLINKKNNYIKNKKIINEKKQDKIKIQDLSDQLEGIYDDIENYNNIITKYIDTQKQFEENVHKYTTLIDDFIKLRKEYEEQNFKLEHYEFLYKSLKDENGIVDNIMKNMIIPNFNKIINNFMVEYGLICVNVSYNNGEIHIINQNNVNVSQDGGFSRFVCNIIYQLSLSLLNTRLKTNIFIIDEATDSSDYKNKENIKKLIKYLNKLYDIVLIVSHDEFIKDTFDKFIDIKYVSDTCKKISII